MTYHCGLVIMSTKHGRSSWSAFVLFYFVLLLIVFVLDSANNVLTLSYWGAQVGLITLGVGIFGIVGIRFPSLSAMQGVLLAFTVGILTIVPAVMMGLGKKVGFWTDYFLIAFGMATGSFLTFLFLKFSQKLLHKDQPEMEIDHFD